MAKQTKTEKTTTKNTKTKSEKEKSYLEILALAKILEKRQGIMTVGGGLIGAVKKLSEGAGLLSIIWGALVGSAVGYSASKIADYLWDVMKTRPKAYDWVKGKILSIASKEEKEAVAAASE